MHNDLVDVVKKRLREGSSLPAVREELLSLGHLADEVDETIHHFSKQLKEGKRKKLFDFTHKLFGKELFDRLGFGMSSVQLVNVLFYLTGASIFLIGVLNGLKDLITTFLSSVMKEYSRELGVKNKNSVIVFGLLVSLSFLLMAVALQKYAVWFFAAAFILSTVFIVFYEELFELMIKQELKQKFVRLKNISQYGLLVSALGLLLSGAFMQYFENGYFYAMGFAAVAFVISAIFIMFIREKSETKDLVLRKKNLLLYHLKMYFKHINENISAFAKDKVMVVLLVTGTVAGVAQTLGNAYYGIYIFKEFDDVGLGGFMNVSIVFSAAMMASLIGPFVSKRNSLEYGKFPMLVFGTVLTAILPLTFYYNPNIQAITMAAVLGVIGSSIVGVARSMLTADLLTESKRKAFFAVSGILTAVPYIFIVPIGAYIAEVYGLRPLFLLTGLTLALIVAPLYFIILIMHHNKRII